MNKQNDSSWFSDLLMSFAPNCNSVDCEGQTPEEMTNSASWKAFTISTAAAIPWGAIGWATILPELIAITKLQINLIYKIAAYHGKLGVINKTLVLLIFANQAGLAIGRHLTRRIGTKVIIRTLGPKALRAIAKKIGIKIGARVSQKLVGRWVPIVLAPIFGAFSKSMTTDIGRAADALFKGDIVIEDFAECPNGHENGGDAKFCQECGANMKNKQAA